MQEAEASETFDSIIVGTSTVGVTGLTIGYVVWLIRGVALLASMISSFPAWVSFDPLPVLDNFGADQDDEDEDGSLVSMVTRENDEPCPEEE